MAVGADPLSSSVEAWRQEVSNTKDELVVGGNTLELLHDGERFFPAMLDAIEESKREIFVEMYWFASDQIGWRVARALMDKAREGLDVRLVYDAVGSVDASVTLFDALRAAGVRVMEYNPITPWRRRFRLENTTRRNHRKIVVCDGNIGFTGGINVGDQWASKLDGGGGWRDDMIAIRGPSADALRAVFLHGWDYLETHGQSAWAKLPPALFPEASKEVSVLANHYFGKKRAIRSSYLAQINEAKRSVYITNSYFVPDRVVRAALIRAARRGVDVRILVPGLSDVPIVQHAGRKLYRNFIKQGVRIYEYLPRVLHSKTVIIDSSWSAIGTYNLDFLSWQSNLEVTAAIRSEAVAKQMTIRFLSDLEDAQAIDEAFFESLNWLDKLVQSLAFRFRRFL